MLLQRFEFVDHRDYQLETMTTLTVKPKDFIIKLEPRSDRLAALGVRSATAATPETETATAAPAVGHGTPLLVLFGSNLGTAEGIANKLGGEASARGFDVRVAALDDRVRNLPTERVDAFRNRQVT